MLSSMLSPGREGDVLEFFLIGFLSKSGKNNFIESLSLNLTFKPKKCPWLTGNFSTSYTVFTWEDNSTGIDLKKKNRGIADSSISASLDFAELLDPSPDKADNRPHFSLTLGTSIPTGTEDDNNSLGLIPGAYQTGTGEYAPFIGVSYSQSFSVGDNTSISPMVQLTHTMGMGPNSVGYQTASSFSWLVGARVSLTEKWSTSLFGGISGNHPSGKAKETRLEFIAPVGYVEYLEKIPDSDANTTSFNIGVVCKPFEKENFCAGISLVLPMSSSAKDDENEMKWAVSVGISLSF